MQLCGSSCFRQKLFHSKHFGVEYGETALQDPIDNLGCDHDTQHADELYTMSPRKLLLLLAKSAVPQKRCGLAAIVHLALG